MSTIVQSTLTTRTYLADGVQTLWGFNFSGGYILPEHVQAYYKDGAGVRTDLVINPATDLVGPFQLQVLPPVPAGYELTVYRATPKDLPLVDFQDGARISERNLDTAARQGVFVAAEMADAYGIVTLSDVSQTSVIAQAAAAAAQGYSAQAGTYASNANGSAVAAAASATAAALSAAEAVGSTADGLRLDLAVFNNVAKGSGQIGHGQALSHAANTVGRALRPLRSVTQDGSVVADGVTPTSTALNAKFSQGGEWIVDAGVYLINAPIVLRPGLRIIFRQGAVFKAASNNLVFFSNTVMSYDCAIYFANFDANGKTGVVGFDLENFRGQSGIYYPWFGVGMENGVILRKLCWDAQIVYPWGQGVKNPIRILNGSNTVIVQYPAFDGLSNTTNPAIFIDGGPDYPTTSVRVLGGYLQGYLTGVHDDGAYGTIIDGVYFEQCSFADITLTGSIKPTIRDTQHYVDQGIWGIFAQNVDGAIIDNPLMTSGSRSGGLFNFNTSNFNCYAMRVPTTGGINLPEGVITGLGKLPEQAVGDFVPKIAGATTAGTATYTQQFGKFVRTGDSVTVHITLTWTGHTGTGAMTITDIPGYLAPATYLPLRSGTLFMENVAFTGPMTTAYLNGSGAGISLSQCTAAGAPSLIPMDAAGTVHVTITYSLK